eukprot:CAMPEP_0116063156 /NCGR_PEP_ID=MMETSP0322-20121206/8241_1 /TAXON_ID=163516 /ORGANISM="Leptocylindrus danicus var. apora, Strain B651" /LENGTH=269 /DNA_ID=CAMNT_0003548709 /DNA_START=243 /DNA_END=1052 /DNA_ORIENTATION=+
MKVSSKDFELQSRRKVLARAAFSIAGTSLVGKDLMIPLPAYALVKGVAPPPPKRKGEGRKCVNVEECQEMAEKLAAEEDAKVRALPPPDVASKGTRYRDIELGSGNVSVIDGDTVNIMYKVLKLGKRSYDGISGEGTVVFSRGYGLEDDESAPGQDTFECVVGDPNVINALSDGLVGMKVGGTRRLSILPQMGWEKPSKSCDGGPGGSGNGGELKTDYVIVPTATVVASETCFDQTKIPFPKAYAEQRRMAQRFDQSLLMEVTLVKVGR